MINKKGVLIMASLLLVCSFLGCGAPVGYADENMDEGFVQIGEKPLNGKLTLPEGIEKPPVVILVQGSGPSDMDETIGRNKPFLDIADGLAENGIGTLRFDKRTYVYPEEFEENVTIQHEMLDDVEFAVDMLRQDETVGDIYVLGHSLGGMMAPKIVQDNPDVAGLVILAGTPRGLEDLIMDQNAEIIEAALATDEQKQEAMADLQDAVDAVQALQKGEEGDYFGMPAEYWVSLNEIDQGGIAEQLEIPMLILQGDADFQVFAEKDYTAWKELLDGKDNVQFKLYEGLNHLFMQGNGKRDASEYDKAGTVDSQVIDDIAKFIHIHSEV